MNDIPTAELIERLKTLEYEIRKSITVREDQEEDALDQHKNEAERYGISMQGWLTKGALLNAVQTVLRAAQAKAGKQEGRA